MIFPFHKWKTILLSGLLLFIYQGHASLNQLVWQKELGDFSDEEYKVAVHHILSEIEKKEPGKFALGQYRKVGLKVSTQLGAGLCTPPALTRAVISYLETRGFTREDIFIIDQEERRLREARYLPLLSTGRTDFEGVQVYALSDGKYFANNWFYDSPLPAPNNAIDILFANESMIDEGDQQRKSFLAAPLLFGVDFWINLPVAFDSGSLQVRGAAVNSSLHLINNAERFYKSSINGAVAVAEINAIPELHQKLAVNLLSLERYLYIGGPIFDANYAASEALLLGSTNPIAIDFIVWEKINKQRRKHRFPALAGEPEYFSLIEKLLPWTTQDVEIVP